MNSEIKDYIIKKVDQFNEQGLEIDDNTIQTLSESFADENMLLDQEKDNIDEQFENIKKNYFINDKKSLLIRKIITFYADKINVTDSNMVESVINQLDKMEIKAVIDFILIKLGNNIENKKLTMDDFYQGVDDIIALDAKDYFDAQSLIDRYSWLKAMNLTNQKVSLQVNHQEVLDTFKNFNTFINQNNLDCYYTGGAMGYIKTNRELERYHSDLDLFLNEKQLLELKTKLENNEDFKLEANIEDETKQNGHDLIISNKNNNVSIGLFLFKRLQNNGVQLRKYYNLNGINMCNLNSLTPEYAALFFDDTMEQGPYGDYKTVSLEAIYNIKKNGRPKDLYDNSIIKNDIDQEKEAKLEALKEENKQDIVEVPDDAVIINIINELSNDKPLHLEQGTARKLQPKNGFINVLISTLVTGFAMGIIATLTYMFLNR